MLIAAIVAVFFLFSPSNSRADSFNDALATLRAPNPVQQTVQIEVVPTAVAPSADEQRIAQLEESLVAQSEQMERQTALLQAMLDQQTAQEQVQPVTASQPTVVATRVPDVYRTPLTPMAMQPRSNVNKSICWVGQQPGDFRTSAGYPASVTNKRLRPGAIHIGGQKMTVVGGPFMGDLAKPRKVFVQDGPRVVETTVLYPGETCYFKMTGLDAYAAQRTGWHVSFTTLDQLSYVGVEVDLGMAYMDTTLYGPRASETDRGTGMSTGATRKFIFDGSDPFRNRPITLR